VKEWDAPRLAAAAGAELVEGAAGDGGPQRVVIDSRAVVAGDLFVGIPGARVDGGSFAAEVLRHGAWGVLVAPEHAREARGGAVLAAADPVAALGRLAAAWRRELDATVIAITGSVGKTSTKELVAAMVAPQRSVLASRGNYNTEIGLPLELLRAPAGIEVLVLEHGMRGGGQIAELAAISQPDVAVITNIGPVHLELLGSLENIAAAKGELVEALRPGGVAVLPADEPLLDRWRSGEVLTFGAGGDVDWQGERLAVRGEPLALELELGAPYQRRNAPPAVAASVAAGIVPRGRIAVAAGRLRGERISAASGAVVIDDCYNANPLSMRAALDDLASQDPDRRRVAVLGDMLELGPEEVPLHRQVGAQARDAGVQVLITVGELAAHMADGFDAAGGVHQVADAAAAARVAREVVASSDVVLVKASRGVGLEVVAEALAGDA
jgi:UDP-N-acetylmuramoyl-tripeptide--D-alanyl-D-alanine ligase